MGLFSSMTANIISSISALLYVVKCAEIVLMATWTICYGNYALNVVLDGCEFV